MSHKCCREGRDKTLDKSANAKPKATLANAKTGWKKISVGGAGNCFFVSLAVAINYRTLPDQVKNADKLRSELVTKELWDAYVNSLHDDQKVAVPSFEEAANPRRDADDYIISFISSKYGINFAFPDVFNGGYSCGWVEERPVVHIAGGHGHFDPLVHPSENVLFREIMMQTAPSSAWDGIVNSEVSGITYSADPA